MVRYLDESDIDWWGGDEPEQFIDDEAYETDESYE